MQILTITTLIILALISDIGCVSPNYDEDGEHEANGETGTSQVMKREAAKENSPGNNSLKTKLTIKCETVHT